jgi:hypothetical protein
MTLLRSCLPLAPVALCATLALPASAAVATTAPPPPELAPLLQKTNELQINSERIAGEVSIIPKKLPAKLKALGGLKLKLSGELSTSPEAASLTTTILNKTLSLRLVDKTIYLGEPAIAKQDGGRPWVKLDTQSSSKLFSSNPSLGSGTGLGAPSGSASGPHFKLETALLKASKDVRSLGASTIDGQAVTGFAGTVDPKQVEESQLSAKLRKEILKAHVKPAATFEIFIAANGVPVHSSLLLSLGKAKLKVTADVLAINFPVAEVAPPPASETITAAELEKLVEKLAKKDKKK